MMYFNEYQTKANKTSVFPPSVGLPYTALGLVGEAGEVAEKIKKVLRGDRQVTPEYRMEIAKEMGDVLWYLAALSKEIGVPLEQIATMNLEKLLKRQQAGTLKGEGDNR